MLLDALDVFSKKSVIGAAAPLEVLHWLYLRLDVCCMIWMFFCMMLDVAICEKSTKGSVPPRGFALS